MFDVVIVGGGAAGLSSALVLGRARRRTLVLDTGSPRNAPSPAAHGVLTRDGTPPAELLRIGRDQLRPYDSVELRDHGAADARAVDGGFEVDLGGGESVHARRLLLAHGVADDLPEIPGMREMWGTSVLHCPYCHGWEVRDEPLAFFGSGQAAMEMVPLLLGWSRDLVLCSDGSAGLDDAQRAALARHGVAVREEPVARLEGRGGVLERIVFADGSTLPRRAVFTRPAQRLGSDLAARLGCEHTETGLLRVDEWGATTVPGVYAAGDITTPMQQVVRAAATGSLAAAAINRALAVEDFG